MQLLQPNHRRTQLTSQLRCQTQPYIRRFAVHHHRGRALGDQPGSRGSAAAQRVRPGGGPAVGQHDHQGASGAVAYLLPDDQRTRGQQSLSQRGLAAGVNRASRRPAMCADDVGDSNSVASCWRKVITATLSLRW